MKSMLKELPQINIEEKVKWRRQASIPYTKWSPSKILVKNSTQEKGINILTPKQILQTLPAPFAKVKAGYTLEYNKCY